MSRKIIILLVLFVVVCSGIFFSHRVYAEFYKIKKEQILLEKKKEDWLNLKKILENKVANFKGKASIVIIDLDTNWEISFNKDTLLPSASLVKLPIMLSCFYAVQDGRISLKDTIRLKSSDKVAGSKALEKSPSGSVFTVEELLKPMIAQSDNSAANALIDFLGFDTLNAYFKKMGLKQTNLARKMLDFEERREGEENYTTAGEMAYLLERLYNDKFLNKDVSEKCLAILGQQKINDRIPKKLPNGTLVAHKTGLERHICHDCGIVYSQKGNFLICVLAKHENRLAKSTKKFISDISLLTYNCYRNLN